MNEKKLIEPLASRTTQTPYMIGNSMLRAVSVISPEFVYYYLNQIVTFGCAYIIGTGQYGTRTSEMFADHSTLWAVMIRITALIIAALPLTWSMKKEYPVMIPGKKNRGRHIVFVVVLAVGTALLANALASLSGFSSSSDAFEKTAANQFSLPVWAGLLVYVLVTPITEEIVHRGVIYNRLRRYFNLPIAVVVSSLLFGISHGNLVQLIYGAVMGVLICLVYERYGAFIYPLVYHCVANAVIYVFMSSPVLRAAVFSVPGIALEALMTVAGVYMIFAPKNY